MKILHIIDSEGLYGAELVTLNLMDAQKKIGLQPVLLSLGNIGIGPKEIEIEAQQRGLESVTMRFRNGFNLKGSMQMLNFAKKFGAQIIHTHGYKGRILLGFVPRRLRKVPVITTLHGWTSKSMGSKIWVYEWLDALAIKNLDGVIAVSSAIEKHPRLKLFGIHPFIINNGLPQLRFENDAFPMEFPELAEKIRNKFKIVSIGRLSPEKGSNILIESLMKIVDRGIDAFLVLFGEGNERSFLTKLAEKKSVMNRVYFAGYKEKAYRFLPCFDVFVLPSYAEGLPITLLEAMQAGVPIVATGVGEIPKVLDSGFCGKLVRSGDPKGLADAIEEIYKNKEMARDKAITAQQRALQEYGVEKMANNYLVVYQNLLKRNEP